MVLELRKMEMSGQFIIHFIWISGKQMISQGSDGLSRGDFSSGVMSGQHFLKHAFDRQKELKNKLMSCLPGNDWKVASTEDWVYQVFQEPEASWVWAPPPALAKIIAVEQMCKVKHIFPNSKHFLLCPALWTGTWRKTLGKIADTIFSISPRSYLWPAEMFEPLTITFFSSPLLSSPYTIRRSDQVDRWTSEMCALQSEPRQSFRDKMREFWTKTTW
jgi:hypothetical protein